MAGAKNRVNCDVIQNYSKQENKEKFLDKSGHFNFNRRDKFKNSIQIILF